MYLVMTDRKGIDLEGAGREESRIRIFYVKEKTNFNKRKIKWDDREATMKRQALLQDHVCFG